MVTTRTTSSNIKKILHLSDSEQLLPVTTHKQPVIPCAPPTGLCERNCL